jgi:hypothetical protein
MSSFDEVHHELLECARYGEDEDLLMLIEQYQANVNHCDMNGNTAMHKASANGHLKCLEILYNHGAKHLKNYEGNYPCHWAAQNGKTEALKFLFDHYSDIDVLAQNKTGKSTVTEAFTSGNTDTIEVCLSHGSATEERLVPGSENKKEEEGIAEEDEGERERMETSAEERKDDEEEEQSKNEVTHQMKLTTKSDEIILIRELPITRADNPFGSEESPEDDTTGLGIWPASILLSRWITNLGEEYFKDKTVMELGAGCGLPGITAGKSFVFSSFVSYFHSLFFFS